MKNEKFLPKIMGVVLASAMLLLCSSCSKSGEEDASSLNQNGKYVLTALNQSNYKNLDNSCVGWGIGKSEKFCRPSDCEKCNLKYKDYNALFIGNDDKKVYLTFDEGYENGYTASILDTLKEKNVKAVFFVTYDYANKNPDLVKRMIDEGHTVGNHSYSHPSMPSETTEEMKNEVLKLHNYIKDNFDYEMTLFRFPRGEYSTKSLAVVRDCGYKSVFWSFAYVDWKTDSQPQKAASLEKVVNGAHNGAIYLLHAVSHTNNAILGDVIDGVRALGYEWSNL